MLFRWTIGKSGKVRLFGHWHWISPNGTSWEMEGGSDLGDTRGYDDHWDAEKGLARAKAFIGEDGEAYLNVNTSDAATSCTLRLSAHVEHGGIATDDVFR